MAAKHKFAVFSSKSYDQQWLSRYIEHEKLDIDTQFHEVRLNKDTAHLAKGFFSVCAFVNDDLSEPVIKELAKGGTKVIAMRCAGFDRVDTVAASRCGITVCRVPAYSPDAVAEYAVGLTMALNRKIPQGLNKCRQGNFSLAGQLGFDMKSKIVGIVGTGLIGKIAAQIFRLGFRCNVIAFDIFQNEELKKIGVKYVTLDELLTQSDVISLHCPLMPSTKHLICDDAVAKMKTGAIIVNTSRGGLVDINAVIRGIKSKKIGGIALDVYEHESEYFFEDRSNEVLLDDGLGRLLGFSNAIVTGHQAFFTKEALDQISKVTLENVTALFANDRKKIAQNIVN